jgi:hypothetical protein
MLPLLTGDAPLALRLLREACDAHLDATWLVALAQAATACGDATTAVRAWCQACLLDPSRVDAATIDCTPVLELPELVAAWLPLAGRPAGRGAARRPRAGPRRDAGAAGRRDAVQVPGWPPRLDEPARIAAKRELMKLVPPGLRDRLRSI